MCRTAGDLEAPRLLLWLLTGRSVAVAPTRSASTPLMVALRFVVREEDDAHLLAVGFVWGESGVCFVFGLWCFV
jgi:hypothetical protein